MCGRVLLVVPGIPLDVGVSLPSVTVFSGRSGQEGTVNVFVLGHFSPCMFRSVADQAARFPVPAGSLETVRAKFSTRSLAEQFGSCKRRAPEH